MMVQTADVRDFNDPAAGGGLRHPPVRCVLVEREVRSPPVIVRDVLAQRAPQRALVPDDDVVEALAPQGADHALDKRILPRSPGRREDFVDTHCACGTPKVPAIDRVAIPDDKPRSAVPGPRLAELLRGLRRSRVRRDVHVDEAPSTVREHDEDEQDAEGRRGNREEVD